MYVEQKTKEVAKQTRFERYASPFTLSNTMDFLDLFKSPLPSFNMRGRSHIPSFCGVFATILIYLIASVYGLSKFIQMMQKHNPDVSSFLEQEVLTHEKAKINFRDKNFRVAFGFEGFLDKELKDDERFVKTFVRMVYKKNGVQNETMIPHRRCRPEDFDLFAPSGPSS